MSLVDSIWKSSWRCQDQDYEVYYNNLTIKFKILVLTWTEFPDVTEGEAEMMTSKAFAVRMEV